MQTFTKGYIKKYIYHIDVRERERERESVFGRGKR
jgi:hypothetical protein